MIWLATLTPAVLAIAIFAGRLRVRPRRTLSMPLGDATDRRRRLRLVMGGGGR
jgi:hypothetical protein